VRGGVAAGAFVGLLVGIGWLGLASALAPLRVTCAPAVPADVCAETADAGLRRGMPRIHPLITEAAVAPGPEFPDGYGHRATVTYSLLPGPTVTERLFFDAGGHWGAVPDRSDVELFAWALLPVGVAMVASGALGGAVARRRAARAPGGAPTADRAA
jgi:hypothetical protein